METTDKRLYHARVALKAFKREVTGDNHYDTQESMGDLICNLFHLADSMEIDRNLILVRAHSHYYAELYEELKGE